MMETTLLSVLLMLCFISGVWSSAGHEPGNVWTYRGSLGPEHWHLDYPHCGGVKQSPISVVTDDVVVDKRRLTPITFQAYDSVSNVSMTLQNNGHTVQVDLSEKTHKISGSGLPGTFIVEQYHFHWGAVDGRGSEHDVNGEHFPMEMHIVHYNQKYDNFSNSLDKNDGLAVLAFFFKVGRYNEHFEKIINHFKEIQFKDTKISIDYIPLVELIPAQLTKFYRYQGSLTTPPCYESVTWTIFNETIEIAEEQLEVFRNSIFQNNVNEGGVTMDISDDFRPVQCMFRRKVYSSTDDLKFNPTQYRIDSLTKDNGANMFQLSSVVLFCCTLMKMLM